MIRRGALLVLTLALLHAPRAAAEPRLIVRWDDCPPTGTIRKAFACDTNTGAAFDLVLAVSPPAGVQNFVGFVAVVDFDFESQATPSWWDFPGCRAGTDLRVRQAAEPVSCPDIFNNTPFFMAHDYALGVGYPGRARLRVAAAVSEENAFPLAPDSVVALCTVSLSRRSTVGASSCAGCEIPVCILFNSAYLDSANPDPDFMISGGFKWFAEWQQPIVCPFVGSPTIPSTWGALKSLYRR